MKTHETLNPRPRTWQVMEAGSYEQITNHWKQVAEGENKPFFMLEGYHKELEEAVCATLETRKSARAYIESIGGSWK